jgi:NADH-quinone oxidoreductase subunit H
MSVSPQDILMSLFYIVVFPGLGFLSTFSMWAEYLDRVLHARLQNRLGPPWYQPMADFIKLCAKQDLVPELADRGMFRLMPPVALAACVTAILYVPMWSQTALFHFTGDLVVVLYLLTIPTVTFFLGGWYARSCFSMIGAARTLMQMFAYEIPMMLALLAPALLVSGQDPATGKDLQMWSLTGMAQFYGAHPAYAAVNAVAFVVALVALLGKLERVPFDIPEAETEIVAGAFTEYSGRRLALFRLAIDVEMVVAASVLVAVFVPFGLDLGPYVGFALYVVKVLCVVALIALLRTLMARLRIDQMIDFCWKIGAPVALAQVVINLAVKGVATP